MTLRGTCDACGKAFRLPAAGRAYRCKTCGGTVHPEAQPPEEIVDLPPEAHHVTAREHRERIDAIHRAASRKTRLVYGGVFVVLALLVAGFQLTRPKPVSAAGGVARDLAAATDELVRAWNAGDREALATAFHPQGRADFRARLARVAEHRGWTAGFEPSRGDGASMIEGTIEHPLKAVANLACGEESLRVRCSLQFDPGTERWYLYHVDVPPPPLAPTLERFCAAWELSSPQELTPLFPPDSAQKLTDLVERKTRELGWAIHPELREPRTTGEHELRRATERVPGLRVETFFAVPGGELKLRWLYRSESDEWYVAALVFPKSP